MPSDDPVPGWTPPPTTPPPPAVPPVTPPAAPAATQPPAPPPGGAARVQEPPADPTQPLPLALVPYVPRFPATPPSAGAAPTTQEAPAKRPRRAVVLLTAALVVAIALGGALVGRMLVTTHAWQRSSADWEALARTHGADLATAQQELSSAQAQLTDAQTQLATAQARITELADEKAQLGDTTAAQTQLADYQARVSQAAGNVATALAQCITGQQKLIGYLEESDRYDPADLARFKQDVTTVCGAATDANAALQRELQK